MKPPLLLAICTIAFQAHHTSQAAQITLPPLSGQVSLDPGSWTVSPQTQMIALIVKGL